MFKPDQIVFVNLREEVWEAYHTSHEEQNIRLGKVKEELIGLWLGDQRVFRVHMLGWEKPYTVEQIDMEDIKPYHEDWVGKKWEEL